MNTITAKPLFKGLIISFLLAGASAKTALRHLNDGSLVPRNDDVAIDWAASEDKSVGIINWNQNLALQEEIGPRFLKRKDETKKKKVCNPLFHH